MHMDLFFIRTVVIIYSLSEHGNTLQNTLIGYLQIGDKGAFTALFSI